MSGVKTESIRENGKTIRCTDMGRLSGLTEESTRDNTTMIKNMGLVHFTGQMGEGIMGLGRMENSMEGDSTS